MMKSTQELTELAQAAFKQAAKKVIERARQTGTPVILWEDGKIKEVAPESIVLDQNEPLDEVHGDDKQAAEQ